MKNFWKICLLLALATGIVMPSYAEEVNKKKYRPVARDLSWNGKKSDHRTGLYTRHNKSVANGIMLSANAVYYYGDIDMLDQAFLHGFQPQNLSAGGSLRGSYMMPAARSCNWRFSLSGGYMHGNDSARMDLNEVTGELYPAGKGMFKNIFGEATAGIEWYPFSRAGLYIYGGLGFNVSSVSYDFFKTKLGSGHRIGFVPLLAVELGYNFYVGKNWFISVDVGLHQALFDIPGVSMDAWPLYTTSRFQWGDGYFQIGLSVSYRWNHCIKCTLSDDK
ncbi:MAG: hypothetical protein MJZ92_03665 [Paludibacteraceae bacterium]|nr:hypothetical protein [Paludibacteraceae bacterium]